MHSIPKRRNEKDKRTRLEQYGLGHPYCSIIKMEGLDWMVNDFHECGMYSMAGMGIAPLTWLEVAAYSGQSSKCLTSWESTTLIKMSRTYFSWYNKGQQQTDLPDEVPFVDNSEEAQERKRAYVLEQHERSKRNIDEALNG